MTVVGESLQLAIVKIENLYFSTVIADSHGLAVVSHT
jgi:hypothetical protein